MSNDFEIKIKLKNIAYYCLCIFIIQRGKINIQDVLLLENRVNPLYILGLSIIVIYACCSLIKFIKTNPYDNRKDSKC